MTELVTDSHQATVLSRTQKAKVANELVAAEDDDEAICELCVCSSSRR